MYCCVRHNNTCTKIKRRILIRKTSFGRTKVKNRLRVTKSMKSGKAHFTRVYKDMKGIKMEEKKFPTMKSLDK